MRCFLGCDSKYGAGPTSIYTGTGAMVVLCVKILIHADISIHETEDGPIQRIHNKFRLREIRDFYSPLRSRRCCSDGVLGKRESVRLVIVWALCFRCRSISLQITIYGRRHGARIRTHRHTNEIFMGHNRPSGIIKGDSLISVCSRLNMANSVRSHFLTTLHAFMFGIKKSFRSGTMGGWWDSALGTSLKIELKTFSHFVSILH